MKTEDIRHKYNPEIVKGHIRIDYQDAGFSSHLSVSDVLGESELSDSIRASIETAFKNLENGQVEQENSENSFFLS